jgi:hypothetical protein
VTMYGVSCGLFRGGIHAPYNSDRYELSPCEVTLSAIRSGIILHVSIHILYVVHCFRALVNEAFNLCESGGKGGSGNLDYGASWLLHALDSTGARA